MPFKETKNQRAAQARYRERNREAIAARQKQYYAENTERRKAIYRKSRYGITQGDYDALVKEQQGLCAICGEEPPFLVVDHNHDTKKVRGLLCDSCNLGIGRLKDDVGLLLSAAMYLLERDGDPIVRMNRHGG